jgi:hypothetical protein
MIFSGKAAGVSKISGAKKDAIPREISDKR